ncbi:MAG: transglycosylase SLT domain-containing protein [Bacteroidota bacterium]
MSRGKYEPLHPPARPLTARVPKINLKHWAVMAAVVVGSNLTTHYFFNNHSAEAYAGMNVLSASFYKESGTNFYLADRASQYIYDLRGFYQKVQEVSQRLGVKEEWLLAVMDQESQFNPSVANFKGSGATGLIQFMPGTAAELGTTTYQLASMDPIRQMDYVYQYLATVRERYGDYKGLTDLYLAILYPKARGADMCFTLFAKPSRSYKQNSGLDEDKDGRVTVSDIDHHLRRKYPDAFLANGERGV